MISVKLHWCCSRFTLASENDPRSDRRSDVYLKLFEVAEFYKFRITFEYSNKLWRLVA